MSNITLRYYYTMDDLFGTVEHSPVVFPPLLIFLKNSGINFPEKDLFESDSVKELWELVWAKFFESKILYVDKYSRYGIPPETPTPEEIQKAYKERATQIYIWVVQTFENYNYLYNLYKTNLGSLMDSVKTSSTTKFNDTPQTEVLGGEDEFTSNITKFESSNDLATKISRIEEIRQNLRDIMAEWVEEFEKEFVLISAE